MKSALFLWSLQLFYHLCGMISMKYLLSPVWNMYYLQYEICIISSMQTCQVSSIPEDCSKSTNSAWKIQNTYTCIISNMQDCQVSGTSADSIWQHFQYFSDMKIWNIYHLQYICILLFSSCLYRTSSTIAWHFQVT